VTTFVCPSCQRSFTEAGFCPYDGHQLSPAVRVSEVAATMVKLVELSEQNERPGRTMTVPQFGGSVDTAKALPPANAGVSKAEVATQRDQIATAAAAPNPPTAPGRPPSRPAPLRAVSASEDHSAAIANLARKGSVYDQLVGQTLDGRYFIERKIGEGGMGVVYSARHAVIERPLAIKVLKPEALRDRDTITRFAQEAKAASRIGHPNIVDVTDFGTTPEGMTYSVMEYVKGTTLAHVIKGQGALPVPRAAAIAQQLARALGAAHDKGIVHRDLKPENIFLVERDGRPDFVKIVDFGIAKVTPIDGTSHGPRLTKAGSVFGTPEYMAPEQAAGRSDIDGRVDIYALGIIMYEMITGALPLKGDTAVRTIAMQLLDPIVPPTQRRPELQLGAEIEAIVMRALAKRREDRYRTMAELQAALELLLRRRPERSAAQQVVGLAPLPPGADPHLFDVAETQVLPTPSAAAAVQPEPARPARPAIGKTPSAPANPLPPSVPIAIPSGPNQDSAALATAMERRAHRLSETPLPDRRPEPALSTPPPLRAIRDEPEFVRGAAASFEHVFVEAPAAPPQRRWPVLVAALLVSAGAAAGIVLLARGDRSAPTTQAQQPALDAGGGAPGADTDDETDEPSGPSPAVASDAGAVASGDGEPSDTAAPSGGRRDGRGRRRDARNGEPRRDVTVQIITYPDDGTVYRGRTYRGPGGTTVQEPYGTVARFTCTKVGYKDGFVDVKFDDKTPIAVCVMARKKLCVDNLKNPYDHCPDAGAAR
jgi:serine/threonine protein kinase